MALSKRGLPGKHEERGLDHSTYLTKAGHEQGNANQNGSGIPIIHHSEWLISKPLKIAYVGDA